MFNSFVSFKLRLKIRGQNVCLKSKDLLSAMFNSLHSLGVYNHWIGLVDWTGGVDYWTQFFHYV